MPPQPPVWLITGCSSGLGLSLAKHALSAGHLVIATSRNPLRTPHLVSAIESLHGHWLPLDVTSPDLSTTIAKAQSIYGRIDILVNNAGYAILATLEDTPDASATAQFEANFHGPFRLMKAVLPGMRKQRSGVIMNVSSTQGLCPSPTCSIYAASKAALEAASESLSVEVAQFGIRVLIVEPGAMRTNFSSGSAAEYIEPTGDYAVERAENPVMARVKQLKAYDGTAPGDPDKAARVMFEAVTGEGEAGRLVKEHNLLRVIIGPDSWGRIDGKIDTLRKTADVFKDVAGSTNLD
jgi:NAD(P)-dependent dehydrogenase (short-subunit alcohol dehydrogenase family)